MSATIDINKSKFVIFGAGHDYTLADSGIGEKDPLILYFGAYTAIFDRTDRYCWISTSSYNIQQGIHVLDMKNGWEEVEQDIIPTGITCLLLHPINVSNNIGIAILSNSEVYVFDLTEGTIIKSGTIPGQLYVDVAMSSECYMFGDKIYFINATNINYHQLYTLDLDDFSLTYSNNNEVVGFIDDDSIYTFHGLTWYADYYHAYSYDYALSNIQWEVMGAVPGSASFDDVYMPSNFTANGYIYAFTKAGTDKWKLGKYNASSAPDFITPSPQKLFGEFDIAVPTIWRNVIFSNTKRYAAFFILNLGLFYTDFENVYKLDEPSSFTYGQVFPLGMDEHYILIADGAYSYLKIYQYR